MNSTTDRHGHSGKWIVGCDNCFRERGSLIDLIESTLPAGISGFNLNNRTAALRVPPMGRR